MRLAVWGEIYFLKEHNSPCPKYYNRKLIVAGRSLSSCPAEEMFYKYFAERREAGREGYPERAKPRVSDQPKRQSIAAKDAVKTKTLLGKKPSRVNVLIDSYFVLM